MILRVAALLYNHGFTIDDLTNVANISYNHYECTWELDMVPLYVGDTCCIGIHIFLRSLDRGRGNGEEPIIGAKGSRGG